MDYAMVGPAIMLSLPIIGSAIGCALAWMVCQGVMSRVEEGHGKFIGLSCAPSTQAVLGIVLTLAMKGKILAGELSSIDAIAIAVFVGVAMAVTAIYQGMCAATAIQASAKQPAIFGKASLALGIVEGFAIFVFVFAFLLM